MRASSANQISISSGATPLSRAIPSRRAGNFFEVFDGARGLRVMARTSRKLAIPQRAEFTAHRLRRDGHPKLLKGPLAKIGQPPAHDAMNRRDWAVLDHPGQRRAA